MISVYWVNSITDISLVECKESKQCAPAKHHFDECVERVTGAEEGKADKKHPHEDCVEECKRPLYALSDQPGESKANRAPT
jgi:Ubiquinol-cytochrome C reductase hinge protein